VSVNNKTRVSKKNRVPLTKKSIFAILFALYLVFILLSQIPFLAEDLDTGVMDDTYESHLTFSQDGKTGHYYVERYDTQKVGRINVLYTTDSNSLEVDCTNIKVLRIYCREMYEKKSQEVFKRDPALDSNYYKTYFINKNYFKVHVFTEQMITELEFIDTPIPYNVKVNSQEWWLTGVNYTYNNDGIVFTKVPVGHSYVDIYFKSNDLNSPIAQFTTSKTIIGVGESLTLNASTSYDPDGEIISYVWDFGEGTFKGGVSTVHSYIEEGTYKIILTVTDDSYLIDRAFQDIIVVQRVMDISKAVDKPIATPGSVLTYTITSVINSSWKDGVKDIVITDILPEELDYVDAEPLPELLGNTLTWKLGIAFNTNELSKITLEVEINEKAINDTFISNYASLEYNGIDDQLFPMIYSNYVETKVNTESLLTPRIKSQVPDIELLEDSPPFNLDLTLYEYDVLDSGTDLDWYITDKNESLYQISGEYSDDDVIVITPLPNAYGNSLVRLWLADGEGYTTRQPLWINITPVNDNPIFSSCPDLVVHYEEPYTFDYESYIYDIDTAKEDLQLFASKNKVTDGTKEGNSGSSADTEEGEISINGFKVTYEFPKNQVGKQIYVSLIVFDGEGTAGDTIRVNVTDDYTPTLKEELPDVWLVEGETKLNVFDIDDYFEDPDGDSLFYSFGDTHVRVVINEDHTVDFSSPTDWNGVDEVTFRARDPAGAIAEDIITVTVGPINDPPNIAGVPETFIVHYDADYSFDLTPYITDEDNELNELFLILIDENIRTDPLNQLKIIMNYPKSMVDWVIPVKLIVSDGIDTGIQNVTVKVTDSWPPNIIKEISDVSFYEDDILINAFDLDKHFSDKDSDTLYYTYGNKNVIITINLDGSVDFSAEANWYGVERVTFRATDPSAAFVESVITVTVHPVNDPPIISPLPVQYGTVNQICRVDLTNYIHDIDNDLSELIISVDSEKLEINIISKELVIFSNAPITENILITVNDGMAETSESLVIEIKGEESEAGQNIFQMWLFWILILIIIIILSITGFASWRKYVGNYDIEEIFCIYNNGILISHANSKDAKHAGDEYLVSGMLTAIVNFTQDAFTEEGDNKMAWGIKEIQMNEKNILVDRGNYTFLATVFSGRSGIKLYSKSRKVLESIENKYKNILPKWKGNANQLKGVKNIIKTMLSGKSNGNS